MTMLWITVERAQKTPIIRQVYDQLRLSIVRGDLQAGEQLPSTRVLARALHVSRIVIVAVYDQLLAEGYIESRPGSGTYVAQGAYLEEVVAREPFPLIRAPIDPGMGNKSVIDFRTGLPALDLFPRKLWGQLVSRVCAEASPAVFGYDLPEGCLGLRDAQARHLRGPAYFFRCWCDVVAYRRGRRWHTTGQGNSRLWKSDAGRNRGGRRIKAVLTAY